MSFHYCLVGKTGEPLASVGNKSYEPRVLQLLPKVNINKQRVDYEDDKVTHHALNEGGYTLICTTDASVDKLRAYTLLEQIKDALPSFSLTQYASTWTLQKEMEPVMKNLLDDYHAGRGKDAVSVLGHELDETKNIMAENATKAIERGVNLQDIMVEADQLEASAFIYKETTKQVKRKYWRKNIKLWMILCAIFVICIVIFIIILANRLSRRPPRNDALTNILFSTTSGTTPLTQTNTTTTIASSITTEISG